MTSTLLTALQEQGDPAEGCAACATCGGMAAAPFIAAGVALLGVLILNIVLMAWVGRDAKGRGLEGATWLILMFFTGPIGLIVYLFARPSGVLVECQHCRNQRLAAASRCPHCGH